MFSDTKINIAKEGKRHLGAVIGSNDFRTKYVNEKVTEWCSELKILSEFAKSQPQAAYAAFYFGEQNKFIYFLRTIPEMKDLMKPHGIFADGGAYVPTQEKKRSNETGS